MLILTVDLAIGDEVTVTSLGVAQTVHTHWRSPT